MRGNHLRRPHAPHAPQPPPHTPLPRSLALCAGAIGAVVLASCSSGPSSPSSSSSSSSTTTTHAASSSSTTTTLPPASTSGPLQAGGPIALPFSADRVTAAESPDGAAFASPQDPASASPTVVWVIDGNGPAAVAEHIPTGVAALAADATNLYVATYTNVTAFDRTTGNQGTRWTLPAVHAANASDDNRVAMTAAGGQVYVSITQGNTVTVYGITPSTTGAPRKLVAGLGDAIGPDGSIYAETTSHTLAVRRPDGSTKTGPALAASPNGSGGGVQFVDSYADGAVWTSEPAGQGLDAQFTTYDSTTLDALGSFGGTVGDIVVDTQAGPLVLVPAGNAACPITPTPSSCVLRIDAHGVMSNGVAVGQAVQLTGPAPAVVVSDTATSQFDLIRLS